MTHSILSSPSTTRDPLPNPKHVPLIANAVLAVVLLGCAALLLGAPVEGVLSVADNPLPRVVVVTFAITLIGLTALAFSTHLLLHRHRRMENELKKMRELVEAGHARTSALAATADELEHRVDETLDRVESTMADERERMREHVRTYLDQHDDRDDAKTTARNAGARNGSSKKKEVDAP